MEDAGRMRELVEQGVCLQGVWAAQAFMVNLIVFSGLCGCAGVLLD
jgi:hypothetical protein